MAYQTTKSVHTNVGQRIYYQKINLSKDERTKLETGKFYSLVELIGLINQLS